MKKKNEENEKKIIFGFSKMGFEKKEMILNRKKTKLGKKKKKRINL